jgi:DNA-binding transcriptional regulator YbjK
VATPSPERFAAITDAAIALIAGSGMRGLTHRAVDARAGLPPGSTSAYLRTRRALIEAVVRRLADLDQADLDAQQLPPAGVPDVDTLAAGIAGVLDEWMTAGRVRMLTRYACLLEATHHPELRDILQYGVTLRTQSAAMLAALGAPDPDRRGAHLVAAIDGLLFDRLAGAGALSAPEPGTPESRADLTVAVTAFLRGALAG